MSAPEAARFDSAYASTPPWEIGTPQEPFLRTADSWRGQALDSGCGTGELALAAAARGLDATGIDGAPRAIRIARERAAARGLTVDFVVGDVLRMPEIISRPYQLVFDSGVFHVFDDDARTRYVRALTEVTEPGGRLLLMCFSDRQEGDWGPRRISRAELERAFVHGWRIDSIEPAQFKLADVPAAPPFAAAWFAQVTRL